MKTAKSTRRSILKEALERVNRELMSTQGVKAREIPKSKRELIMQMLDELPHTLCGVPHYQMFDSDYRRYYQEYIVTIDGWESSRTHTSQPRGYISGIDFSIERSSDLWDSHGTSLNMKLEPVMALGDHWILSGKYDRERHERYDLGLDTALKIVVDSSMLLVVGIEWLEPYHESHWREVAVPEGVLVKFHPLLKADSPDLQESGIAQNSLLFHRKVKYPDRRVMEIRVQTNHNDCWLSARLLDRNGKVLTAKCYLYWPHTFQLHYGGDWYQASTRGMRKRSRDSGRQNQSKGE